MSAKKPMKPIAKRGMKGDDPSYQPRMTDPASGRKMVRGQPVDNAGPIKNPPQVKDPYTGQPMTKGKPVEAAYSDTFNKRVGLGLRTAGEAIKAGFKPAYLGDKGRGDAVKLKKPAPKKKR